ncbi:MAG: zinc ribbon domain-containing protein [Clostridiales bacterium]|nr:zinc ribbon domain-containing protein [Clostridiales bacterium]
MKKTDTHKKAGTKKQLIQKISRFMALLTACVAFASAVAAGVVSRGYYNKARAFENTRNESLQNIARRLEFSGLDDEVKGMMQRHAEAYSDYANFIVIDHAFKVQYSLNSGYMDGGGYFFGLLYIVDDYEQAGVVCDKEGNILSTHYIAGNIDINAFARLTSSCTVKPVAAARKDAQSGTAYRGANPSIAMVYTDGIYELAQVPSRAYGTGVSEMYFAPMAAKGLYMYYIYDTNSPKWTGYASYDEWTAQMLQNALRVCGLLSFMLYWAALAVWVFLDADRRNYHPALWGVLTLFTNVVGMIIYMVVRPERITCASCKEPLDKKYAHCPYCGARVQAACPNCNELVAEQWAHCPYCGTELPRGDVMTAAATIEPGPADGGPAQ